MLSSSSLGLNWHTLGLDLVQFSYVEAIVGHFNDDGKVYF